MSTIRATYVQHGSSAVPNITLNASGEVIVASGLVSSGTFAAPSGTAAAPGVYFVGDADTGLYSPSTNQVAVATSGTARLTVDDAGRLLVGTSTAASTQDGNLQVITAGCIRRNVNGTGGGALRLEKTRSAADGSYAIVSSGDNLGDVEYYGSDGTQLVIAARIRAEVDGTPGANDMPGRLVFSTTADGASSPTERMRIQADGQIVFSNQYAMAPTVDNLMQIGGTGKRFSEVWAANGAIQTSDQRTKTEITTSSLGSDFIKALRPVSYKWIEGGNHPTGEVDEDGNWICVPVPGQRTHWGFIAQEVKQAVDGAGVDFGGWILTDKDNPDSQQALRYDQFIAPLTKALQEALAEIDVLKAKVAALETP